MLFFDEKFKTDKLRYLLQCLMAAAVVFAILLALDTIRDAAVIAALGASSFIAFTMPHMNVSHPRFLIGGYVVGIITGCGSHHLLRASSSVQAVSEHATLLLMLFGALAVGLAIFTMVITNTEHPPAASLALGLAINGCTLEEVLLILIGIVTLALAKHFLKPLLRNLI
jgi:CBS-domain-containing membrane protein